MGISNWFTPTTASTKLRTFSVMHPVRSLIIIAVLLFAGLTTQAKELTVHARAVVVPNPTYDTMALVQIPFMIYRHEFEFYRPDSTDPNWYTQVFAQATFMDSSGLPFDSAMTYFTIGVPSLEARADSNVPVFNTINSLLRPGSYSARIEIIDVVSKRTGNMFITDVKVPSIEKSRLTIAATQLAYTIRAAAVSDSLANLRLIHHGLFVLTNPLSVFTDSDSMIYVYGEVYNLSTGGARAVNYRFSALKEDGTQFLGLGGRKQAGEGAQRVLAEHFDIKGWPLGLYMIRVIVDDSAAMASDTADIPFRIVSPRRLLAEATSGRTVHPYDTMSISTKEHIARWLLTPAERTILSRLNDDGKDSFLHQYWTAHDPVKTTPENEYLAERISRFIYANENFSRNPGKLDGWESERGRVHIVYGPSDEIDDMSVPLTGEPLQVWHYRALKEGKYFIFEQQGSEYDFRLVHSNVNGEPYSKRWEDFYKNSMLPHEDLIDENPDEKR